MFNKSKNFFLKFLIIHMFFVMGGAVIFASTQSFVKEKNRFLILQNALKNTVFAQNQAAEIVKSYDQQGVVSGSINQNGLESNNDQLGLNNDIVVVVKHKLSDYAKKKDLKDVVRVGDLTNYAKKIDLYDVAKQQHLKEYPKKDETVLKRDFKNMVRAEKLTTTDHVNQIATAAAKKIDKICDDLGKRISLTSDHITKDVHDKLIDYAKKDDLEDLARVGDLTNYAKKSDLYNVAKQQHLKEYPKKDETVLKSDFKNMVRAEKLTTTDHVNQIATAAAKKIDKVCGDLDTRISLTSDHITKDVHDKLIDYAKKDDLKDVARANDLVKFVSKDDLQNIVKHHEQQFGKYATKEEVITEDEVIEVVNDELTGYARKDEVVLRNDLKKLTKNNNYVIIDYAKKIMSESDKKIDKIYNFLETKISSTAEKITKYIDKKIGSLDQQVKNAMISVNQVASEQKSRRVIASNNAVQEKVRDEVKKQLIFIKNTSSNIRKLQKKQKLKSILNNLLLDDLDEN